MWSAPRRRLGRTSPWASRQRSSGPSNWICQSCWESRYLFCVWKSTRRGYRWKKETVCRQGKDGHPARHRDVKVGCVFTQTTWDAEGYAIRDPDATTYVAAIETAEEFGKRIYLEAWKRG